MRAFTPPSLARREAVGADVVALSLLLLEDDDDDDANIDDVVDAVTYGVKESFPDGTYNLCGDEDISFLETVQK